MYHHRSLKIVLVILLMLVVGISWVSYSVYENIRLKNENHHTLLYNLSFQDSKQTYYTYTQKVINSLDSETSRINNTIISKEGDVAFIEGLESIARENGLSMEIDSLVFANNTKLASSSIDILKIKARTRGSWSGSYVFLTRLELLPFKIKVNKFDLAKIQTETSTASTKSVPMSSIWEGTFEIDVLKYK